MRLATWNVNSLTARLPRVLEFLERHAPDVLLLQETKVDPAAFPNDALEQAGYRAAHHSGGRWAGVAIVAREPISDSRAGLAGEPATEEARWIEATVAGMRIASVYVPNGRAVGTPFYDDKLRFLEAMAARVASVEVIGGDFNVCPADLDVYDPAAFAGATHVTPAERARFAALLDGGMVDAFRMLHPDEPGFTWWDYRAGHFHRGLGLRIDAILVARALASRLGECGIDRDFRKGPRPSDHAPLLAQLNPAGPGGSTS